MKELLLEKIQDRSAKVAVIGLGYVGLPLATILAEAGFEVIGIDPDQDKINALARGESYIQDIPPWSVPHQRVAPLVEAGKLRGMTDYAPRRKAGPSGQYLRPHALSGRGGRGQHLQRPRFELHHQRGGGFGPSRPSRNGDYPGIHHLPGYNAGIVAPQAC